MDPTALSGTLVVMIPTRDGMVVAADSRGVIAGEIIDYRTKLHTVDTRPPIVFAVTGAADFPVSPPPGKSRKEWLRLEPYLFRSRDVIASVLSGKEFAFDEQGLEAVARSLGDAVGNILRQWPNLLAAHAGRALSRLAMCQVDPDTQDSLFGSVALRVGSRGEISLIDPNYMRYRAQNEAIEQLIGEGLYVHEFVYRNPGWDFLGNEAMTFLSSRPWVRDLGYSEAAEIATAIIKVTERTTSLIPVPSGSGIGGPVTRLLVGADAVRDINL